MLSVHSKSDTDFTSIEEFPPDDVSMLDQVQVSIVDQQLHSTESPQHKTSKVTSAQTPKKSNNFLILAIISLLIALLVTVLFYQ